MKHIKFFFPALVLIVGCSQEIKIESNESNSEFDREKVTLQVTNMLHDYHNAVAKGGLMTEFLYLDSSTDFFWIPPGSESSFDYDIIRSMIESNAKTVSKISFEWEELTVYPLSAELASFSGKVLVESEDTSGVSGVTHIIESGNVIRREDGWKLLNGQSAVINNND